MKSLQAAAWALAVAPSAWAAPSATPNADPFFVQQWSLHNDGSQVLTVDIDDLHSMPQKSAPGIDVGWLEASQRLSEATAPVTVAVIDSGIDPKHPDLAGRVRSDGWDFLNGNAILSDDIGHGTHVAGIIAANAGNGVGIAGIAPPSVQILPLRIFSKSFTSFVYNGKFISDYAADAIRYATAHGASVINMSLGWPKLVNTDNVRKAVSEALAKGVLIVAAAGNDRKDQPTYPCAFEGVLCVGSVSNNGELAIYSNSGGAVDLLAPGDGIVSLFPRFVESSRLRIQGYEMLSGTSQASPHVAGIAAAIKSLLPSVQLNELKARLLVAGAALPEQGAALYGLIHLQRALEAQPHPVFVPDFKLTEEALLDEKDLEVSGSISVANLWQRADQVAVSIRINGTAAGEAHTPALPQNGSLTVPWHYRFESLEAPADLRIEMTVSAKGLNAPRVFSLHRSAARPAQSVPSARTVALPAVDSWIGANNGHLFSRLSAVASLPAEPGLPRYYQQLGSGDAGSAVQIVDPSATPAVTQVLVPGVQKIIQVMRMDATGAGARDWIITGLGTDQEKPFFQFFFLGPDFKPLWGTPRSVWRAPLDTAASQAILRNYASTTSWLNAPNGLLPCFLATGQLPDPDNFDHLDPRHYKSDLHLYYLQLAGQSSQATRLELRAMDSAIFRTQNPGLRLRAIIPSPTLGSPRVLAVLGDDLNAAAKLWEVQSTDRYAVREAPGWDALSAAGQPQAALTASFAGSSPAFLSFFDSARGSLAWATPQGKLLGRSEFSYRKPQDAISGLIGAFDLTGFRSWFLESRYDLVAFIQGPGAGEPVYYTLPIERDSTFPSQQFSEMLSPVLVGDSGHPQPGVYIDATLVRGNRVAVATLPSGGSSGKLEKPLRYSLEIPEGCVQMPPTRMDESVESFAIPMLCRNAAGIELRMVRPGKEMKP